MLHYCGVGSDGVRGTSSRPPRYVPLSLHFARNARPTLTRYPEPHPNRPFRRLQLAAIAHRLPGPASTAFGTIDPQPEETRHGHAGGDVASEDLIGQVAAPTGNGHITRGESGDDGHFTTHFDEPSLDYSVTETKITEETREEMR